MVSRLVVVVVGSTLKPTSSKDLRKKSQAWPKSPKIQPCRSSSLVRWTLVSMLLKTMVKQFVSWKPKDRPWVLAVQLLSLLNTLKLRVLIRSVQKYVVETSCSNCAGTCQLM